MSQFKATWLKLCEEALALADDSISPRLERFVRRKVSHKLFEKLVERFHKLTDEIIEEYLRETADNAILIDHNAQKILRRDEEPKAILIVNSFDGSQNGVRGIPFYGGSIAVARYGSKATLEDLEVVVVRNYATNDVYIALKNGGAYLNRRRIYTSMEADLDNSLIGIDTDMRDLTEDLLNLMSRLRGILKRAKDIRRMGCSSLEVCEVARGAIDAFIDIRGIIDIVHLAPKLIVEEAGGIVTDDKGNPLVTPLRAGEHLKFIASANERIHQEILSLING